MVKSNDQKHCVSSIFTSVTINNRDQDDFNTTFICKNIFMALGSFRQIKDVDILVMLDRETIETEDSD